MVYYSRPYIQTINLPQGQTYDIKFDLMNMTSVYFDLQVFESENNGQTNIDITFYDKTGALLQKINVDVPVELEGLNTNIGKISLYDYVGNTKVYLSYTYAYYMTEQEAKEIMPFLRIKRLNRITPNIISMQLSVSTTAQPISQNQMLVEEVTLYAPSSNTANILIGSSSSQSFPILPNSVLSLKKVDLSQVYVVSQSGTQTLYVIAGGY